MYRPLATFFILVLLACGIHTAKAQDAQFSQFYANPLYLNPAMAGTNVCPRITLNFRDQWPQMPGNFMSYSAGYDQHFDKISGGIGVLVFGDRAGRGTLNTYSASFMYSFKIKVSRKFNIRLAMSAGYYQTSLDWDKLTFGDMIDPKYGFVYDTQEVPPGDLTKPGFDMGAGFLGYTKNFYFGVAASHIVPMYMGYVSETYRVPVKWTAHVGAKFYLKRKSNKELNFGDVSISPNVVYQNQLNFHYFNEGFYLCFYPFTVGMWVRHTLTNLDAIVFSAGVEYDFLRIGYSYDISASKLSGNTGGSHEVSVQFLLPCPEKRRRIKDLDCPHY